MANYGRIEKGFVVVVDLILICSPKFVNRKYMDETQEARKFFDTCRMHALLLAAVIN